MANSGFLFCVYIYLVPILIAVHTYNNLDRGDENENYESEVKIHSTLAVDHKI